LHRSDPQRAPRVQIRSSLVAALLDGRFEYPANRFSTSSRPVGHRNSLLPKWLFRGLLDICIN
jgi:hypothetical protein